MKGGNCTIVSTSNSSLDRFPLNSNSKFTHVLPEMYEFDHNKTYLIGIKSVSLSFRLMPRTPKISYFKIKLLEIAPSINLSLDADDHCLCQVSPPKKQKFTSTNFITGVLNNSVYKKEFKNPTYFSPTPDLPNLQTLTYILTDENNNKLRLSGGPPTIITLEILEMENAQQFFFTVSPTATLQYFPSNDYSDFKVVLPSEITLPSGEWEVALHSVIIPKYLIIDTSMPFTPTVDYIVIYTDIIKNSIFGNAQAPFLQILTTRSIGLNQTKKDTVYYVENLTFQKISKETFNTIHFQMRTLSGSLANIKINESFHVSEETLMANSMQLIIVFRHTVAQHSELQK